MAETGLTQDWPDSTAKILKVDSEISCIIEDMKASPVDHVTVIHRHQLELVLDLIDWAFGADEENRRMAARLNAGPHGEDAIDVAESANGFLRHRIETLETAMAPFRVAAARLFETNANASDLVYEGPHVKHMPDADLTAGDFFAVAAALDGDAA